MHICNPDKCHKGGGKSVRFATWGGGSKMAVFMHTYFMGFPFQSLTLGVGVRPKVGFVPIGVVYVRPSWRSLPFHDSYRAVTA